MDQNLNPRITQTITIDMVKYVIKELTDDGRIIDPLVHGGWDADYNPFAWENFNTPEEASARIDEEIAKEGKSRYGAVNGITYKNLVIVAKYVKPDPTEED